MKINKLMEANRLEEIKAIYRFIFKAGYEECSNMIGEMLCCHDNIYVIDKKTGTRKKVKIVGLQGEDIVMYVEEEVE